MSEFQLRVTSADGEDLGELRHEVNKHCPELLPTTEPSRSGFVTELILALGSAGAFTALYNILKIYLHRHKDKKIELTTKSGHIVLSGHSVEEANAILERLGIGAGTSFSATIEQINSILEEERQTGVEYDSNRSYWRLTGQLVLAAVYLARKAVYRHIDMAREEIDFNAVVESLSVAKHGFDVEYPDEDGYGAAAFHAIIRGILEMMKDQGRPYPKSHEELIRFGEKANLLTTSAYELTISPIVDEAINIFASGEYAKCFDDIVSNRMKQASETSAYPLARLAAICGMRAKLIDKKSDIVRALLEFCNHDAHELALSRLAIGEKTFEDIKDSLQAPIHACPAHYWAGAFLATIGKRDEACRHFTACIKYDFDRIECVLAKMDRRLNGCP